ncbi:TIGR02996 domain-containing protein [Gemmata sp.]|uniref:TIGR02996 domain-containing protein n=1 Tax=Gemmata sp. TaxID=1914242 RepID=UPI003F6F3D41
MPTTDDERALLAAIVADPADDTVRLAYADCIEERGNAPRAAFIRTQIEAEHHHIDSPRRAALAQRARELFSAQWIEWWTEVCEALGFVVPVPRPTTRFGRLADAAGFRTRPGSPYTAIAGASDLFIYQSIYRPGHTQGFHRATWRRGFPEDVNFTAHHYRPGRAGPLLTRWTTAAPLTAIQGVQPLKDDHWSDGPHLCGVRSLVLQDPDAACVRAVFQSQRLHRLSELEIRTPDFARVLEALELSRPNQLRRMTWVVGGDDATPDVADCPRLSDLRSLTLATLSSTGSLALALSPYLTELEELRLDLFGQPIPADCRALTSSGHLRSLRTLALTTYCADYDQGPDPTPGVECLRALLSDAKLPHLEELRISQLHLDRAGIDVLVRSPLIKQLKHLAFAAHLADDPADDDLRRLPEMFDLGRIETFAFSADRHRPGLDELVRKLGERLRMPAVR